MEQRCPDCHAVEILSGRGNGKCSACHGGGKVGTIVDDIGGGKRACPKCHGSAQCQTCGGLGVVSVADKPRPHANAELNPFDDKVAVRTQCPKCGAMDWFEWKFLGKLTDPVCGHSWYAGSGVYTARQLAASFQMAKRFAKYINSGASGSGAMVMKPVGAFCGVVFGLAFRLPYGLIMIPIQAVVRASSQKTAAPAQLPDGGDTSKTKGQQT
jgi:hypothetical protein